MIDEPSSADDGRQGIQSIEVGTPLLKTLAEHGGPMMLRDLAAATDMPAAKAHRYLVSFMRTGLVTQDAVSGRYDLGPFALEIGLASLARLDAVRIATPLIEDLNERIEETVALAVWGNMGPTIVRWVESRRPVTVNLRTGAVMPLLRSATGLCFAAFHAVPAVQERIAADLALQPRGKDGRKPGNRAELDAMLTEIRSHGLARTEGAVIPGVNAFSVPVFDHRNAMVLAITALGPSELFPISWSGPLAKAMRECAREASRRLGWRPAPGHRGQTQTGS